MRLTKAQKNLVQAVTNALIGEFKAGDYVEIVRGTSKVLPVVVGSRCRIVDVIHLSHTSMGMECMRDYYRSPYAYRLDTDGGWCVGAQHMRHISEDVCDSPKSNKPKSKRSRARSSANSR